MLSQIYFGVHTDKLYVAPIVVSGPCGIVEVVVLPHKGMPTLRVIPNPFLERLLDYLLFLLGESGLFFVECTLKDGKAKIIMNRVNLLEVFYGYYRDDGKEYAEKILDGVAQSIVSISEFDKEIFAEAGRLKASYKISLADSIALAQAMVLDADLLTADHHEFDVIEGKELIRFQWIR